MDVRFDLSFDGSKMSLEPHHCREWEPNEKGEMVGCYGTNPNHGYSFEEACEQLAKWHEREAVLWRSKEHHEARYYSEQAVTVSEGEA